jgi:hypothetical protein
VTILWPCQNTVKSFYHIRVQSRSVYISLHRA